MPEGGSRTRPDPDLEPARPDASLGQLISEMTSDLGTLLRQEVDLAKLETKEEVTKAAKAGGMFGAAGLAGWFALLLFSFAIAWLLDQAMNTALAFAIVGLVWLVAALVLYSMARRNLRRVEPLPNTVESIKEDVAWAKAQRS